MRDYHLETWAEIWEGLGYFFKGLAIFMLSAFHLFLIFYLFFSG